MKPAASQAFCLYSVRAVRIPQAKDARRRAGPADDPGSVLSLTPVSRRVTDERRELYGPLKKYLTNYTNMVFNIHQGTRTMSVEQAASLPQSLKGGDTDELPGHDDPTR